VELTIVDNMTGLVIFEVANQEFCVDIKDVSAIINPSELKEDIPLNADHDLSVNINQIKIPVISFKKHFGFKQNEHSRENLRLLLLEPENKTFGILAEKVKEIYTMSKELKKKLRFVPLKGRTNLLGVLRYEGRSIYLPDITKMMLQI
jgi:chemotaxis signal transduction protein